MHVIQVLDENTAAAIEAAASAGLCVSVDGWAHCTDGQSFQLDSNVGRDNAEVQQNDADADGATSSSKGLGGGLVAIVVLAIVAIVLIAVVVARRRSKPKSPRATDLNNLFADYNAKTSTAYLSYLRTMSPQGSSAAMITSPLVMRQGGTAGTTVSYDVGTSNDPSYTLASTDASYSLASNDIGYSIASQELGYDYLTMARNPESVVSGETIVGGSVPGSVPGSVVLHGGDLLVGHSYDNADDDVWFYDTMDMDQGNALSGVDGPPSLTSSIPAALPANYADNLYTVSAPGMPPTLPPALTDDEVGAITDSMSKGVSAGGMRLRTPSPKGQERC